MTAHHFDADYYEETNLRDGSPIFLRLVRPDDKEMLRTGFEKLSDESRYRRFFTPKPTLSERELRYLTEMDNVSHLAIGAGRRVGDIEEGVGVARMVRLSEDDDIAEAAIAVIDDVQGKGLGSLLFQRLVAAAQERGIRRIRCEVLGSNHKMLEFLGGFSDHLETAVSSGVVVVDMKLPELAPEHPHSEPPRDTASYRMLTLAAKGMVEIQRLFPWLRPDDPVPEDDDG